MRNGDRVVATPTPLDDVDLGALVEAVLSTLASRTTTATPDPASTTPPDSSQDRAEIDPHRDRRDKQEPAA